MHFILTHLPRFISAALLLITFCIQTVRAQQTQGYPKMVGYFSTTHPIATLSDGKVTSNFAKIHTINFPFGLNLFKSDGFGVSFEVSPSIRTENNISRVSSVAFSPGGVFRFSHGFALAQRVAFETSGRFGLTTIANQILVRGKDAALFMAVPFALRFGNSAPTSLTPGLQVGVFF